MRLIKQKNGWWISKMINGRWYMEEKQSCTYKMLRSYQTIEIHPGILDYPWDFCGHQNSSSPKGAYTDSSGEQSRQWYYVVVWKCRQFVQFCSSYLKMVFREVVLLGEALGRAKKSNETTSKSAVQFDNVVRTGKGKRLFSACHSFFLIDHLMKYSTEKELNLPTH